MDPKQQVYNQLAALKIPYEVLDHPPVHTIEDMEELGIMEHGEVCKNLFLRDAKGTRHFLVVLEGSKQADLKLLREEIGCTRLSFASEDRLKKHLNLTPGAVTPFAVINDPQCDVEVVFDRDLLNNPRLGFHPNENTATVWVSFQDVQRYVKHNGNSMIYVKV